MSEPVEKGPQTRRLTEAELQQDSMFMHWREHHERAYAACISGEIDDLDICEELCEETIMQPWGVPRMIQAEAHAMLATFAWRDDTVEQALAAKEQYRRVFLSDPSDVGSERLYRNAHIFLRSVQKEAGMTELSPLYEKEVPERELAESSSKVDPITSIGQSTIPSPESSIASVKVVQQGPSTPAPSVSSGFAASSAATEKLAPRAPQTPQSRRQRRMNQRQSRNTPQSSRSHVSSLFPEEFARMRLGPDREIAGPKRIIPTGPSTSVEQKDLVSEGKGKGKAIEGDEVEETRKSGKLGSPIRMVTKKKSYADVTRGATP